MNRKQQIQQLGNDINAFIRANINTLDIKKVEDNISRIAEHHGLKVHQINEHNKEGVINELLFVIGDLMLAHFSYDTNGAEDEGEGVEATVNTQLIGIEDKEQFLKTLNTSDSTQRLLYLYVAGKDISEKYS